MKGERVVAGLACSEVLARLSSYLDGELSADERARLEAHVVGCDGCARFGGRFGATIGALRASLKEPDGLGDARSERLREALDDALFGDEPGPG